jgi:rfaE bifunctional protein nucleotidyltransferase chain/domain
MMVTSGCFDILHHGHVTQLQRMRSLGKFLLVGINSDASIRAIKPGRPIIDENNRALMLAALVCVDAVTIFDEPANFIYDAQPDVFLKGGDWPLNKLPAPEREALRATGAIYQTLPRPAGSTTEIIERVIAASTASPKLETINAAF